MLGNQCVLVFGINAAGMALWIVGVVFWLPLTYAMLPGLMEGTAKPRLETGLNGAWLLTVVGTQAISVLACPLVPSLAEDAPEVPLFVALAFWLVGSMLYVWLIALIFHRILFLPLSPGELPDVTIPSRCAIARPITERPGSGTGDGAARVAPSRPPHDFGPIRRGPLARAFPRMFRAATVCGDQPGEVVVDALDTGDKSAEQLLAFEVALGEAVQRLGLEAH